MPRTHLRDALQAEAQRLGFTLFGVTTPERPSHYTTYETWLAQERHGEMSYLASERARQRRADPRQILPECVAIVVLGIRYPASEYPFRPGFGRVASYAWGEDYHEVLPPRLEQLVQFLAERLGRPVAYRAYTDSGPLLERDLAQRAGLGWIGKNTCLIHPRLGSYFLLAELLLDVDLPPTLPFEADRCGSCRRCLEACPTQCILPDRTLDARRCLSYLTIELKGAIPLELRPLMGDWIFGCDVCQQVCPWNQRFSTSDGDPAFAPRSTLPQPRLVEELFLSVEQFRHKFRRSPLRRAKRRGYLRNVAVALGNSGEVQAISALATALHQEEEPLVRGHLAWALGRLGGWEAWRALEKALLQEREEWVKDEILQARQACFT